MRKFIAINGSPRKGGCCDKVVGEAAKAASDGGFEAEVVNVAALDINGCRGCMSCKKTGECVQKDDMAALYPKLREADVLMLATPVYFAAETAQMKCFIDRLYAMIPIVDGKMKPDMGKKKVASIFIPCGAPNGDAVYEGMLERLVSTLGSFGIEDEYGVIVPGASPETILGSDRVKEYLGTVKAQLGSL